MKDLYTFDVDKENAMRTYEEVNDIYRKLFKFIGVPYEKGNENNIYLWQFLVKKIFSEKYINSEFKNM